jgi:hypothetical protein
VTRPAAPRAASARGAPGVVTPTATDDDVAMLMAAGSVGAFEEL